MLEFGVRPSREESLSLIDEAFDEINDTFWLSPQATKPVKDEFIERYSEDTRHYHGVSHLGELIIFANQFIPVSGLKVVRANLFGMIIGHDSIQEPGVPDPENVAKSRELTVEKFSYIGVPQPDVLHMAAGVEATANHDTSIRDDTIAFFLDDDMAIVGTPEERYDQYADDIAKEYSWVKPFELFLKTRKEYVLDEFLARDRIFNTDFVHKLLNTQARINMRRESARLGLRLSQLKASS